jgi:tyrosyl-tRNA synthetase
MASYSEQIRPLFDMSKVTIRRNSEWLKNYTLPDFIAISSRIPVSALLQRRDFQSRLEGGAGLMTSEQLYPVVMALDSVELDSDIEVGGKDQFLNLQMCRRVMEICDRKPKVPTG